MWALAKSGDPVPGAEGDPERTSLYWDKSHATRNTRHKSFYDIDL